MQTDKGTVFDKAVGKLNRDVGVRSGVHISHGIGKEVDTVKDITGTLVFRTGVIEYFKPLHALDGEAQIEVFIDHGTGDSKRPVRLGIA